MTEDNGISFRTLFELANDAIFVADADSGLIIDANRKAQMMSDRTLEELKGLHIGELHPPAERERLVSYFESESEAGSSSLITCSLMRKDGHIFPCELSSQRVESNGRHYAIGIFRDISERIRALEDIHLRNVAIASVSSGVTIADAQQPDIPLIYVNRGFEKITGFTAKEAVGRSCRFLQSHDRDQAQLDILRDSLRRGEHCNVRLRNYRKDGSLFWNELHISPVHNESGDLTHFIGIQLDVTDRVESRRALEASEARYRMLADNVEDMIIRRQPDGKMDFVSPSSKRLLGYSPEALLLHNFDSLVHPRERSEVQAGIQRLLETRQPVTHGYRMRSVDGTYRWVESTDRIAERVDIDTDGPLIVSVCRDITARKRAEEEVQRALERERELNAIKTRFVSLVTHEFKTPMTGIRASATFLRSYGDKLPPEKRERHLRNIEQALDRMNNMLDDVLFVSRSDSGKMPFNPKRVNLLAFCESLIEDLETIYPNRKIDFEHDLATGDNYFADADLLTHVFQNLLGNALKYSPPNRSVRFTMSRAGDDLYCEVEDHGIGIPAADQETLFEPFQRARNVGNVKGTGLGLNIAKRSVERHGGMISFSSIEGEGTTFHVRIPVGVEENDGED